MALFERLTQQAGHDQIPGGVHGMFAAFQLWAAGEATRAQVVSVLTLDAGDETELDAMRATYDALGADLAKLAYLLQVHAVFLACEFGWFDKAKAKTALGF